MKALTEKPTGRIHRPLKPCPFCGCDAQWGQWANSLGEGHPLIRCKNPHCPADPYVQGEDDAEAARKWNTRVEATL